MTPELTALALAGLLQMAQTALMSVPANLELGPGKTLSPRDGMNLEAEVSPGTARLIRANRNHHEALLLFAVAVLVVSLGPGTTGFTAAMAWLYLVARLAYVPAYRFGWVPWRSVFFGVGWFASGLMLLAALIAG